MTPRWFTSAAFFLVYGVGCGFWLVLPIFINLPHQLGEWSILLGCGCGFVAYHYFMRLLED